MKTTVSDTFVHLSRNSAELSSIVGHEGAVVPQGDCGNLKIVGPDRRAQFLQVAPDRGVLLGRSIVEGNAQEWSY